MDRQLRELERRAQGGDANAALLLIQRTADLAGGELHISYSEDPWGKKYLSRVNYVRSLTNPWYSSVTDSIEVDCYIIYKIARVTIKGKRKVRYDIPNKMYLRAYISMPSESRELFDLQSRAYEQSEQAAYLYQFYKNLVTLEECKALFDRGATVEQIRAFAARS